MRMEAKPTKNLQFSVRDKSELRGSQKLSSGEIGEAVDGDHWFEQLWPIHNSFCRRSISVATLLVIFQNRNRRFL